MNIEFYSKNAIIEAASPFTQTSFTHASGNAFYTGWSSMKTLVEKGLVEKKSIRGGVSMFCLSSDGILLSIIIEFL